MKTKHDIGMVGCNSTALVLANSLINAGYQVVIFDRDPRQLALAAMADKKLKVALSLKDLVAMLDGPTKVMLFEEHLSHAEVTLNELTGCLDKGSVIIDAGLVHHRISHSRAAELEAADIRYLGLGIAANPSGRQALMAGGHPQAWKEIKPFLVKAAQVAGQVEPCCHYFGQGGAGLFVKMVHDALEYTTLQMIDESYELVQKVLGLDDHEISRTFAGWNKADLSHSLLDWASTQLQAPEDDFGSGSQTLDPSAKTPAIWASQDALKWGVPLNIITESVYATNTREAMAGNELASELLPGPVTHGEPAPEVMIGAIKTALKCAFMTSYSQGFRLLHAGSVNSNYQLNMGDIARLWQQGSPLSADFLSKIASFYIMDGGVGDFLLSSYFAKAFTEAHGSLRLVLNLGSSHGVPLPCLTSALAYYDNYRTKKMGLGAQVKWQSFKDRRIEDWLNSNP